MSVPGEVPVWVNGVQKWVTGVNKRTTCGELVRALMSAESGVEPPSDAELRMYAIVERWRKVERPLEPTARILKVWRSWSDQLDQVQLVLKRPTAPTPREVKSARRRHHQQSRQQRWRSTSSLEALHPRKLAESCSKDASGLQQPDMVERLMRMIIVQGETIQTQLRRLREREDVISQYEHKMHQTRVHRLGSDYLLRTYLKEGEAEETEKKSNDSGVVADHVGEADDDAVGDPCSTLDGAASGETLESTRSMLRCLNRVAELNSRIVEREEECVRLGHKIRRARTGADAAGDDHGQTEALLELEVSKAELQRLATVCQRQQCDVDQHERTLIQMEKQMDDRRGYLQYLEYEVAVADAETNRITEDLQARLQQQQQQQEEHHQVLQRSVSSSELRICAETRPLTVAKSALIQQPAQTKLLCDKQGDTNSDTGLSSLDSSGDETAGVYMLETLV